MHKIAFIFICISLFGCASRPLIHRSIASENVTSPFITGQVSSLQEVVTAVISRLGNAREQANMDLCVAATVADIVTLQTGRKVSTMSVAVRNFQLREGFDNFVFGPMAATASAFTPDSRYMLALASSTLQTSLKASLCKDDQPYIEPTYYDENIKELTNKYNDYRAYYGVEKPLEYINAVKRQLRLIYSGLDADSFEPYMSPYKTLEKALGAWFDKKCDVKIPAKPELQIVGGELPGRMDSNVMIAAIDAAFAAGTIPALHYDANLFYGESAQFWQLVIGAHVSSLVAKTKIDGVTHYLLRNSWGPSCRDFEPSLTERCDRGHFWVTEEEVRRVGTSVSYYAPKK